MNDKDITKLAAKLTQSLATKDDIQRLEGKIERLEDKAEVILTFAEHIDEEVEKTKRRVARIEAIPAIAHELKLKK